MIICFGILFDYSSYIKRKKNTIINIKQNERFYLFRSVYLFIFTLWKNLPQVGSF